MATKAQIETLLKKLEEAHPKNFFKCVDDTQAGIGAVLRLLHESNETVYAGTISDALHISTARVAVLLKKMAAKGLVTKKHSNMDARVTIVDLTELGETTIVAMRDDMYQQIGHIIDTVGEARLNEFIAISHEIREALRPPKFNF